MVRAVPRRVSPNLLRRPMIGVVTMHELPPDSPTRKWSSVDNPVSGFGSHHIGQSSSLGGHPPGSFLARNYAAHDMQLKQLKGETGALRAMTELAEERSKEMIKQKDEAVNERGRVMETLAIQQEQSPVSYTHLTLPTILRV